LSRVEPVAKPAHDDLSGFVNPLISTGDFGHTFPGATFPFGMVQLSPDIDNTAWNFCSGYYFADSTIMGFSHTHLSGTGVPDLGDFPIMPYTGTIFFEPGGKEKPDEGYRSRFSHADDKIKTIFYTCMYHAFLSPSLYMDVDKKYHGFDQAIYIAENFTNYHIFSLWDTYRALHPLFTIIQYERVDDMINSMLAHFQQYNLKILPIWSLGNNETYCMIGNHAVPVIVDAYLKGIKDFNIELAYEAIKSSLITPHYNSNWKLYEKYGYLPYDMETTESVSKTLEFSFDDWCAAQMAKALNKEKDYAFFISRSKYYINLFDKRTNFMRARDRTGKWIEPFHLLKISHAATSGGEYTEANAWQYTWHVPQDVYGLIALFGGREAFINKLDSLFSIPSEKVADGWSGDVSGLIGQYAHGNEPCHHVAYLYNYAGQSWKTQEKVTDIMQRMYHAKPDGLCGNDDCGQMSAWYIFSALGFYPVNPCGGIYAIGSPVIDKASIHVGNGKIFTIIVKNRSEQNRYIQSAALNGSSYHFLG
jgi:predicted alpha-1,2-mannosidase